MRSYHILQVVRPMRGGMLRHVLDLIEGLHDAGHQVTVAGPPDEALRRQLRPWVPFREIDLVDGVTPMGDWRAVRQVRDLLQGTPYDLVHLHGAKAGLVGRMAARLVNPRPAVVYTVHNQVLPRGGIAKRVLNTLERRLARETDKVITVSRCLEQEVSERHRLQEQQTVTIHNGVELNTPLPRDHARAVLGCEEEGRVVIGAVGRMVPEKGFGTLLTAFTILLARGVDAELVFIGDGPYHSTYQKMAGKIAHSRVRFLGEVPKAGRLMQGFDIIAQPSHAEGGGIVPVEAMLCGCPVVATNVGGLPEMVTHGVTGLLVPPEADVKLADALQELILRPDLREKFGRAGQAYARERFSRQAMIDVVLHEYEAVMQSRQGVLV
ncbi:MAG TPA: glycosyltransferase family 4 protein [Bacilli bacterium]|nr:glycosyltransferase family 4 protein [Bacilli bacterium]